MWINTECKMNDWTDEMSDKALEKVDVMITERLHFLYNEKLKDPKSTEHLNQWIDDAEKMLDEIARARATRKYIRSKREEQG